MTTLRILSGGAAHGLVTAITPDFKAATGAVIEGDFGAVGGMRQRLVEGERPDVVILTAAILGELGAAGIIEPASIRDIGRVATSVAVRVGDPIPDVGNAAALRHALLGADAIFFPDPELATAGIHFRKVLQELGIFEAVSPRLRMFPNGATAMRALAASTDRQPIGCTQATEIVATSGIRLVADLPEPQGLSTTYTAGITIGATSSDSARALIALLTGEAHAATRSTCAFSPP
jgi:molybdate transport system substrate-binding protein